MRACIVLQDPIAKRTYRKLFNELFSAEHPIITGDLFSGCISELPDITAEPALYKGGGHFGIQDEKFYSMPVTNRGISIITALSGSISLDFPDYEKINCLFPDLYSDQGFLMAKFLTRLSSPVLCQGVSDDTQNYADKIYTRIVKKFKGVWSSTTIYNASAARSRVIICLNNCDLYFHLVYDQEVNFYALVWTDETSLYDSIASSLSSYRFSIYSMSPMAYKNELVIHPLYLIDKWKKWCAVGANGLSAVLLLDKYLKRLAR